jgi:hypothetical protein
VQDAERPRREGDDLSNRDDISTIRDDISVRDDQSMRGDVSTTDVETPRHFPTRSTSFGLDRPPISSFGSHESLRGHEIQELLNALREEKVQPFDRFESVPC